VRDATLEVECCSSTEKARVVLVHVKDAIATNGSRCLKRSRGGEDRARLDRPPAG
jgi:hypothetical protein